ncbi:zinc finger protein MSN4 [Candidozyma pseudohaemuli]|uniref:Zinc finger protein MSN4 n=1 Tax=Candidozyma pseudohaemuli TaxID=418784 RepID=A0A2P7YYI7_9ASCO|nr:zinc finger protein MSN4 [[Candida] pseudohaemulonii]PSK41038.1 zinc finger protein MSN4 [[Candida] pseudohaemulonii]
MSYSSFGIDSAVVEPTFQSNTLPQVPSNEWIPPPASLTTIDYDGLDLNDEIFLNNQNPAFREEAPTLPVAQSNLNYRNLQSNLSLPEMQFALPFRTDPNSHYSHRRRFSLAVEQLDRMSLQQNAPAYSANSTVSYNSDQGSISGMNLANSDHSQRSSTSSNTRADLLDQFGNLKEERTVNPRELFGSLLSTGSMPAPARYVLPLLMLSPSLGTIFKGMNPSLDETAEHKSNVFNGIDTNNSSVIHSPEEASNSTFIMNDECVSAITYWLNNTANVISESDNAADRAAQVATKSSRPGWRRNNSIQVLPSRSDASPSRAHSIVGSYNSVHKKRRQKSFNNAIPDIFASELASESLAGSSASDVPRDLSSIAVDSNNQMPMISPQELALFTQGLEQVPGLGQDIVQDISLPSLAKQEQGQFNFPSSQAEQPKAELSNGRVHEHGSPSQSQASKLQAAASSRGAGAASAEDEPKPFPCPECDKQFKRLEHLKRHIRSVHSNIRPFHCKYCEKKFSRSDNLAQHLKTHFKVNSNGTTTIVYGNPNPQTRGRKRSTSMTGETQMNVEA